MRAVISTLEERLDQPTAKGLASAVTRAIRDGALAPGDRLPPIRQVAEELMVSPTTVSSAWQLLARSGAIRSDGRRGTTVAMTHAAGERYRQALTHRSEATTDLSTGIPDPALLPDLGPALSAVRDVTPPGSYLDDPVLPALRESLLADWPYEVEDLLIADGAMDALDLIVRVLLRPGDLVAVENPAFPPLLDLLEARDVQVLGLRLDDTGVRLDDIEGVLPRRPVAIFLQPRGQNPTGVSMSPTRARHLARLLAEEDCFVVEDDSGGSVGSSGSLSLGRWLPERVIHVRSFSKSHGPDLRLAAMSGPPDLMQPIRQTRALGQGWSSRLLQQVLTTLLADPESRRVVDRARAEYARRRALVVTHLGQRGISVGGTDGLNIWVPVRDESAAVLRLASHGIAVTPGAPFLVDSVAGRDGHHGHIRVTTGLVSHGHADLADLIADAAEAQAWSAQQR